MTIFNFVYFQKDFKKIIFTIVLTLLFVYFAFHSIYGNRGLIAYFKLNHQLDKTYIKLENLRAERIDLEHNVTLLRPESLDKDILDELARKTLGVASPKERVFTSVKLD